MADEKKTEKKTFKEMLAENPDKFDYADCTTLERDTGIHDSPPGYLSTAKKKREKEKTAAE